MTLTVLTVASAAATMGGQFMQGQAAYTQAKYEQAAAKANQASAEQNVRDSIDATQKEAARRQRQTAQLEGQQTASMAANGIDLNFGSAVDVAKDTKMIGAEDVGSIYQSGFQQQHGYLVDAYNARLKGMAAKSKAKSAGLATAFGMASTALGAATQIAGMKH